MASLGCLSCLSPMWLLLGLCMLGQVHMARRQVTDEVQEPLSCGETRPEVTCCWPELPGPSDFDAAFTYTIGHTPPGDCSLSRCIKQHHWCLRGPVVGRPSAPASRPVPEMTAWDSVVGTSDSFHVRVWLCCPGRLKLLNLLVLKVKALGPPPRNQTNGVYYLETTWSCPPLLARLPHERVV